MNILITGGAGYLGSIMVPTFLLQDHDVTVVDNFMFKQTSLLDCCHDPRLNIIRGDARDESLMEPLIKKADVIIPLACLTGAPLCHQDPHAAREVIVGALQMILKHRSLSQIFLYPTTNSGYGIGEKDSFCTEESPLRPISLYGKLKVEAESMVLDAKNSITFRLATAFGVSPRMRLDLLVNDFVYRAVYDRFIILFEAHFRRNFIHVRDIAKAFSYGLNHFDKMKNQPYNVGLSDANLTKTQLCETIQSVISDFYFTEANIGEDPDKRDYVVSNERIEGFGFKPDVSLLAGIQELIKGYQVIKRSQYANV